MGIFSPAQALNRWQRQVRHGLPPRCRCSRLPIRCSLHLLALSIHLLAQALERLAGMMGHVWIVGIGETVEVGPEKGQTFTSHDEDGVEDALRVLADQGR